MLNGLNKPFELKKLWKSMSFKSTAELKEGM